MFTASRIVVLLACRRSGRETVNLFSTRNLGKYLRARFRDGGVEEERRKTMCVPGDGRGRRGGRGSGYDPISRAGVITCIYYNMTLRSALCGVAFNPRNAYGGGRGSRKELAASLNAVTLSWPPTCYILLYYYRRLREWKTAGNYLRRRQEKRFCRLAAQSFPENKIRPTRLFVFFHPGFRHVSFYTDFHGLFRTRPTGINITVFVINASRTTVKVRFDVLHEKREQYKPFDWCGFWANHNTIKKKKIF